MFFCGGDFQFLLQLFSPLFYLLFFSFSFSSSFLTLRGHETTSSGVEGFVKLARVLRKGSLAGCRVFIAKSCDDEEALEELRESG